MELDWSVEREGDASLVGFRMRNDGAVPRRVRVESRLDGPVLPPRRGGVAAAGWDATGVTAVIGPGDEEAFGFAALADPVEPPVEVADVESADADGAIDRAADRESDSLVRTALRDLDGHRPPRRAVAGAGGTDRGGRRGNRCEEAVEPNKTENGESDTERDEPGSHAESVEPASEGGSARPTAAEPTSGEVDHVEIDAWFAAAEARIDRAERLTDADLATATAVVEETGGLDAVEGLDERVAADAEQLRAIRDRAAALAERAEAIDIPAEALEALT